MDEQELVRRFPNASRSVIEANIARLPDPQPEPNAGQALDSAAQAKARGIDRVIVRFTRYCVRPVDADNAIGGTKFLCDSLRHSGLISGDEPWRIKLEFEQIKVGKFSEQKTEVELIY